MNVYGHDLKWCAEPAFVLYSWLFISNLLTVNKDSSIVIKRLASTVVCSRARESPGASTSCLVHRASNSCLYIDNCCWLDVYS